MEVLRETPPPLPPKTKISNVLLKSSETEYRMKTEYAPENRTSISIAPQNGVEVAPLKIVNNRRRDEDGFAPPRPSQAAERTSAGSQSERTPATEGASRNEPFAPRIITWGSKKKPEERPPPEDLYENVSNGGPNYLENRLGGTAGNAERSQGKRKTPKIEVRQEENKTVVKISIKDNPTPEEEMNGENRFKAFEENAYENGFGGSGGFAPFRPENVAVYENCDNRGGEGEIYENASVLPRDDDDDDEEEDEDGEGRCYENVELGSGERFYANVSTSGRRPRKESATGANYRNLNGDESECDQVYKNGDFHVSKNNVVSIISNNSPGTARKEPDRQGEDDESYEFVRADYRAYSNENLYRNGQKTAEKADETAEKLESRKTDGSDADKSSVVEVFLQKPAAAVKADRPEAEYGLDDNSSGDPFDSGTCSDVDSLPNFAQTKKGNVVVTIKSLQHEDPKKGESGHRRAESLTSSGVGVDSEESDDDKSNISCDSLNSNEPYPQSNSEDHGYHTPNSEDKTGSPIEQMEYENVIRETRARLEKDKGRGDDCDKPDIIQQVANASRKMKSLRMENSGIYTAKLVESSEFDEYENVHVFDHVPRGHKKKPAPPPPPPPAKPSPAVAGMVVAGKDKSKSRLPTNLLRDIRSRNVRLSATYPSGEKPESGKNSVADAVADLEGNRPGKEKPGKPAAEDPKQLMVEERTYEERKTEVKSVKTNKICAIEVDTDKFYKFHLAENVRDEEQDEGTGHEYETFAGVKDYLSREKPAAITSAKGTIRGVKNRVKAGIATFLQMHENKSYKDRDAGKVVVYTTTMGIVRETFQKCLKVKQILRTLMVRFEERDVFMSSEAQEEIRDRMKCKAILVPQVFVEGQHIGDAETIERLNEMGELRTILKPYKCLSAAATCEVCGGYRLLPCRFCNGSKKSVHRNNFTAEFVSLKCVHCDAVGLMRCYAC